MPQYQPPPPPPPPPGEVLLGPPDGAQFPDNNIFFSWTPVPEATMYLVEYKDNGPRDLGGGTYGTRETSIDAGRMGLQLPGPYRWRVTPVNDQLRTVGVEPSPWQTFTIG